MQGHVRCQRLLPRVLLLLMARVLLRRPLRRPLLRLAPALVCH